MPLLPKNIKAARLISLAVVFLLVFSYVFFSNKSLNTNKSYASDPGDGADGNITISSSRNLNTDALAGGRTPADGEAFQVSAIGTATITVSGTGSDGTSASSIGTSVFSGDEVLLINLQGTSGAHSNVGNYEFCEVLSVSSAVITCQSNIANVYGESTNSDLSGQSVVVQRVPNYQTVTINSGGILTANAWDGTFGGIVAFRANTDIIINSGGKIEASELGYRGGTGATGNSLAYQGESYAGLGTQSTSANFGGGGGGTAYCCGGNGGDGGGGGAFRTDGATGSLSGPGTAGSGGSKYGSKSLTKLFFGSAGGQAGHYAGDGPNDSHGGNGGGIVYAGGVSLTVSGSILSNGQNGGDPTPAGGALGGGGGAGGSIYLDIDAQAVGVNNVTALKGTPGAGNPTGISSDGMVRLEFNTITGVSTPTYFTTQSNYALNPGAGNFFADIASTNLTSNSAASATSVTVADSALFTDSDEIVIIGMQGASAGDYETKNISSISGNTLNLNTGLANAYDGTSDVVVVQRVLKFSSITVPSGGSITAESWNGSSGAIIFSRITGNVTVNSGASISVAGKGFRGGLGTTGRVIGRQGESTTGYGGQSLSANGGGGGGGSAYFGVGDGGDGGGGGSYATAGTDGGLWGGSSLGGSAGATYGDAQLDSIYLGSGGGQGGKYEGGAPDYGSGGNGGGIIFLDSSGTVTVSGTINANGADGQNSFDGGTGRGAGGAGGSIYLRGDTLTLGSTKVTADKGVGFSAPGAGSGGDGGDGRIRLDYNSVSGSTSPAAGFTGDFGYKTSNLSSGLTAVLGSDWSTDVSNNGQTGISGVGIVNTGTFRIATFNVNFSTSLDWSSLTADSNGTDKAFFDYPGGFSALPGASGSSYTLYVPKGSGNRVAICPGVSSLAAVNPGCSGVYTLNESSPNVTVVSEGGVVYWKISGLTSTGGISLSGLSDLMTRLQVSTASDHTIQFSSINGATASGNTLAVVFDPTGQNYNLTAITIGDIDLELNGSGVTLAASAGASTWGTNINTSSDTITFTAPTSGTGYLPAGGVVVVKIGKNATGGTNQIINPATVNSYELHMIVVNGSGTETGEVEVPIIDDDTVNVTGYIDTFISFDIDTASTNVQCDAAGGGNPCDSYGGATDNSGYVVDLGEMTTSAVNNSGDSVPHADGGTGAVNSIYFDLSTNASGGAAVTVTSLNGALLGPGASSIPTVGGSGEQQIVAGSSLYGINSHTGLIDTAVSGSALINTDCDGTSGVDYYCDTPTTPTQIFTTNNLPVDTLRIQWEVAASPNSLNSTGTYTDQLTFIATATF